MPFASSLSLKESTVAWVSRQLQKRVPHAASNRALEGPFAPVVEERTETRLRVTGEIPRELEGLYARIGPNPMQVDNPAAYHWFTGDGMVHGVNMSGGDALWYRNRWVGSDGVNKRLDRPRVPGPRRGVPDVVNTNIIGHGGRLWALIESGPYPAELDGEFNTLKRGLFDSAISAAYSPHPRLDPATGELHAICYDTLNRNRVQHIVVDRDCRVTRIADIAVQDGPMIHDCVLTATRVAVLDLSFTFSNREFLRGSTFPYCWNPHHQPRVGLLPRTGNADAIRWYGVEPCLVFHVCNAFDLADGGVAMDVIVHLPMPGRRSLKVPEETRPSFERWTLAADGEHVQRRVLSDRAQEFPRFDERLACQPYRYAYTVGFRFPESLSPACGQFVFKHDLHAGSIEFHDHGPRRVGGEAVFVPRHAAAAEDEGWLIAYVYDTDTRRSDLVILDARNLGAKPQALIHLPCAVPMGFHGNWIARQ